MLLTTAVALTCTVNDAGADKPSPPNISLEEPFEKIGVLPGPFVVHLHCGDGKLTCGLLKREGVVVQGLDTNRTNVETARRDATLREDYGSRITFRWFDGTNLPYVDNLVNLLVVSGGNEFTTGGPL
mgnify:CR=1 FL=1